MSRNRGPDEPITEAAISILLSHEFPQFAGRE